jgi:hypothetical protein
LLSKFFSRQFFFVQKDFPFPKYQKKNWREKIYLAKKFLTWQKRFVLFYTTFIFDPCLSSLWVDKDTTGILFDPKIGGIFGERCGEF